MAKRVFFSFHYQDVIDFRANVVRKSWITKADREEAGFFGGSLWEEAKRKDNDALKRLINGGLDNTTVTTVLIGSDTHSRRWVRYEIMKSLCRGNKLVGVHINSIQCKNRLTKTLGAIPFDYLDLRFSQDGNSVSLLEWNGKEWITYSDLQGWGISQAKQEDRGKFYQLSKYATTYDWTSHDGYNKFSDWIE